ncbi:MAG: NAD(P)/FAD-dependent oxidoreductase [Anaerolineales bacterium]
MSSLGPLKDGGNVAIIGGAPAGAGCALALLRMASDMGRRIHVTIIERKEFAGELDHNQCLGVLSPPLPSLLKHDLNLPFPSHLSRGEIHEYIVHGEKEKLSLDADDYPSVALRRVQFDEYMLNAARERGAKILRARAVDLEFQDQGVVIETDHTPVEADVVVGAFGLEESSATMFEVNSRYRKPKALESVVTKYHPGDKVMDDFGLRIHAFLPTQLRIEFGAITPKGNHLSIIIAGQSVDADLMKAFLRHPNSHKELANLELAGRIDSNDLDFYTGRFPRSIARDYYGDRYVMAGDAAGLVRAFKGKGVTAAVQTGIRAANVILKKGISKQAFHTYYRKENIETIRDLPYSRLMRLVTIGLERSRMIDPILRAAKTEPRLQEALYDAVSGRATSRHVWANGLSARSLTSIARSLLGRSKRKSC